MDNHQIKLNAWQRLRPSKRKLIQLYAALLYNAQLKGFSTGKIYTGPLKNMCVPGLNCYSCPGAVGACPLGALQNALASSTTRAPAYVFGILILFGLLLGRTICGFLCPVGLIQELLYKIPTPKLKKSRVTRVLSYFKYVILAVFVVAIPLYYAFQHVPMPGFCKYICPAGTLEGAIGLLSNSENRGLLSMLNIFFTRKFIILVLILAAAVFIFRVFCRFICPLGAIYGLFCRVAMIGVHVDESQCIGCGLCVKNCKMDVRHVGDHECIHCGKCMECCPKHCISFHVAGHNLKPAEPWEDKPNWKRILPYALMGALLVFVLIFANLPQKSAAASTEAAAAATAAPGATATAEPAAADTAESTAAEEPAADSTAQEVPAGDTTGAGAAAAVAVGADPGMRLADFTAPYFTEDGRFSSADCRGKVLIINFWATWCTPCVNELPDFALIAAEYPDTVQVIAIHSNLVTEDVAAWIDLKEIHLDYALDVDGSIIAQFGDGTLLPQTVIVDPDGIITYNEVGAIGYDSLKLQIEKALGQ